MKDNNPPHQPSLRLNILANYGGKLWTIISVYIFIPVYVHILGIDSYGLIAFNSIVLSLLFFADAGLTASFAREAANKVQGQELLDLLISIERVLAVILVAIGGGFIILAPAIADGWLDTANELNSDVVVESLRIMPCAIIPQIMISLYVGGLMGLQRQISANLISITSNVIRSGLVIIPIYLIPDARVFFLWQAAASFFVMLVMRSMLCTCIRKDKVWANIPISARCGVFKIAAIRKIKRYSMGMFGMSVIAGVNTQLDKLVVSKMLTLDIFANYSLVSILGQIPYILTLPIATALFPRLANLLSKNNEMEVSKVFRESTYYIALIGAIAGVGVALFIKDLIKIWLAGDIYDSNIVIAARLLAIGGVFLALQLSVFQLSLANGHNKTNVHMGFGILLISVPMQVFLTYEYGVVGAAIPWLLMNAFAFIYLGIKLNKKFQSSTLREYFILDTIAPVLIASVAMCVGRMCANIFDFDALASCLLAFLASLFSLISANIFRKRLTY